MKFFPKTFFPLIFFCLTIFSYPTYPLSVSVNQIRGDGKIRLFNYHLDEFLEIEFRKDETVIPAAIEKINHLLRSRENSKTVFIDLALLDILDHLQDHFEVDTVEIISAYRTKELNESLLQSGHAVSPISLHTQGKAADIHLDEIREETLRDYLVKLKSGGVGYYGMLDFVHVDTGPERYWEEPISRRKLIGVLEPQSPAQLISDKNEYLKEGTPQLRWQINGKVRMEEIQGLKLERFWRGKWVGCETKIPDTQKFFLPISKVNCPTVPTLFGKYRVIFHMQKNQKPLSSNEFYLKKE